MSPTACSLHWRRGTFLVLGFTLVLLLVSLALGFCLKHVKQNDRWMKLSADFAEQANNLGEELPPGGVGAIHLPPCDADELILLGPYCSQEKLVERLPHLPPGLLNHFYSISQNKFTAPFLIWLREGGVLSIDRAKFLVGICFTVNSWQLSGPREIKVIKEKQSPSGFLSISFVED